MRNLPNVSVETRERVLRAARALNYVPSDTGRALSTRATRRIAVVAEELTNPYYPELIAPLSRCLSAAGYRTVLITDPEHDDVLVEVLSDGSYDGVVLTTALRSSRLPAALTARGVPHVLMNRTLDRPVSASCAIDNRAGVHDVVDLLLALGHRRFASLQGPVATSTGRERADALRAALAGGGIRLARSRLRRTAFGHDAAFAVARELLSMNPRPEAIVCGNDVQAMGVLSAARALHIRVPGDLTVVGFDDIPMAGWPMVDLTTVRVDREQLATATVQSLLRSISGQTSLDVVRFRPQLMLRGTHGPP